MPQSRTRYQRAAMRSRYRKPKRKRSGSFGWNVAIAVVVIVGIVAVILVRGGGDSAGSGPPRAVDQAANEPGDHWHTALDVNICGEWLDPAPAFEKPFGSPNQVANAGIHSHADGLIHTHPFVVAEEGNNAVLGKFFDYGGWSVSADSIDLGGANTAHAQWPGPESAPKRTSWSNGDTCPFGEFEGEKVQLTWAVDGKKKTGNPAEYHMKDGETLAIYMLPKGAEMEFPPAACTSFNEISDQNTAVLSKNSPCRAIDATTTTLPAATTTVPAATSSSSP
jgi:hypothetical protein